MRQSESGRMGWRRTCALGVVLFGLTVPLSTWAQGDKLREAVRLHAPDARSLATAERAACASATPACARLPELTLLEGFLTLSEGDAGEALRVLDQAPAPAGLEAWHAFYRGQALFYSRRYAEAAVAFAEAQKRGPPSLSSRARARYGEALLQSGDARAALPIIEQTARAQTPELLHLRLRARLAAGKKADAQADRVLLALRHPAHPLGEEAWAELGKLKPAWRPTGEQRLGRARALLDAGRAKEALAELESLGALKEFKGAAKAPVLALVQAQAHYALGDDAKGDEAVGRAMKGPKAIAADAAMTRARRALRAGDRPRAKALMRAVADEFGQERPAEDALYLAGWIALQQGETKEAVDTFILFGERFPTSGRLDEVLWFRALSHLRAEQWQGARTVLGDLVQKHGRSALVPQARYWSARSGQLGGAKAQDNVAAYSQVAQLHGQTFYGALAGVRLGELGAPVPVAFGPEERPRAREDVAVPAELAVAQRLSSVGLFRDAHLEVETRLSGVKGVDPSVRWGHALAGIGAYGHAYKLAVRNLWGAALAEKRPEAVSLMYPLAYRHAVEREASASSVPRWLVWSIMRRESAFRPEVTSGADARGLMQVIPPTAREIARQLGETPPAPDALYSPEVNIRYGAWYLGKLKERFGHPALVAAAYNAGPNAVMGWVKTNGSLPLDLFVELIPFKETRGYVKTVMGDYHLYQSLYEAPEKVAYMPLTIPEPRAEGVAF